MAVRRSKYAPRSRKRSGSGRSYGQKKGRKRSTRRTTRKRSRGMSARRIINITSQKKSDTMLCLTDVYPNNPEGIMSQTAAEIQSENNRVHRYAWMPSARPAETSDGQRGSKIDSHLRTASTIYARGTKERIIMKTNSSTAWEWRRITFQIKDFFDTLDPTESTYFRQASNGMVRLVTELGNQDIFEPMFRGSRNLDWIDEMNAPLDRTKIDVRSDVRRVIRSGNDSGIVKHYNLWYPINKNIVYRDDEEGESMFLSPISTASKPGSGDYYIVDLFRSIGGVTSDVLEFLPNSTFYWHEK